MRDDHCGPKFAEVKKAYPNARRYHWSENAYDPSDSCWLIARTVACADGIHEMNIWDKVFPRDLV